MDASLCAVCETAIPYSFGRPRLYCSESCKCRSYRERRAVESATFALCEVDGCDNRVRSKAARWCERHYIRWYRHGDPTARKSTAREATGKCVYCGGGAPSGRVFCSQLCRTRDRVGADIDRQCAVCDGPVPFTARSDSLYCSVACRLFKNRAARYSLSVKQLSALIEAQGDACAICGCEGPLVVDHCHDSLAVRGLLCGRCNSGIGMLQNSPTVMRAAADYIEASDGAA